MKSLPIVFELTPGTTGPRRPVVSADAEGLALVDLRERVLVLQAGERRITAPRFVVSPVDLPDFLDADLWCENWGTWEEVWALGVNPDWTEDVQCSLMTMQPSHVCACAELLATRSFKSPFREEMAGILARWTVGAWDERSLSPFTPAQWDALTERHVPRKVESILRRLTAELLVDEPLGARRFTTPPRDSRKDKHDE